MGQATFSLRKFPLFSGLSPEDAEAFQRQCVPVSYRAGVRIFDEGEPARGFYLVLSGQVKIFKLSPRGQEHILAVIGPGGTFAEAAAFLGRGYPASTECLEDSELVFVEREPIRQLLVKDPDMALRMMAGMALKLRSLVAMVEDLTLRDARGRLARYLLGLAPAQELQPQVKLPTQQTVLARLLGLTQETLSRTLKGLKEEGLVSASGRSLTLDVPGLRAVLGDD
jgi:CRP/FNR family transcriptional regulator